MPVRGSFEALRALILSVERLPARVRKEGHQKLALRGEQLVRRQFREGRGPYGRRWREVRRGGRPLHNGGTFMRSFQSRATSTGFVIYSTCFWWDVHNKGKRIYAKAGGYLRFPFKTGRGGSRRTKWAQVKSVYIPKRQIIPTAGNLGKIWSTAFAETLERVVTDAVVTELL